MKIKLKDNATWIAEQKKGQKKRAKRLGILFTLLILMTGIVIAYSYVSNKNGFFYPNIRLTEAPTGEEPDIYISDKQTSIIKCPTIPYTMVMSGEFAAEGSTYCIFLDDKYYLCVMEISKLAEPTQIISNIILPGINATSLGNQVFKEQKGYMNNRYIETFGCTYSLERGNLYTVNYRIFLNDCESDILITAICTNRSALEDAHNSVRNIFYTLHKTEEDKVIADNTIEGLTENDLSGGDLYEDVPMDEGYAKEGEAYTITPTSGFSDIPEGIHYKSNCEAFQTVEGDYEKACFVFAYEINTELESIVLYDPTGEEMYFPEPYEFCEYMFQVDNPAKGTWKFVYTAKSEIGVYRTWVESAEEYTSPLRR